MAGDQRHRLLIRFIIRAGMLEAALVTASGSDERSDSFGDSFIRVVRERETQVLRTAFRILGNWADAEDVAQEYFCDCAGTGSALPMKPRWERGFIA
jgi:Sigma-70 region 2